MRQRPVVKRCQWDADQHSFSKNCTFTGGFAGTFGLPCGPTNVGPDGAPCSEPLRPTRAWEHTASVERDLGRAVRVGVDVVYRRPTALPVVKETNRLWNVSGADVIGYRNGRAETIVDYSSGGDTYQRYRAVTASARKQVGAFRFLLAYTRSQHEG